MAVFTFSSFFFKLSPMDLKDTSKTILDSAKSFFSGTAISRAFGLIREVIMASFFGSAPAVAAFWMAFRFSYLFRRIFGEGALNVAFVPYFESLRKQDAAKGARFFYNLTTSLTLFLLFLTILCEATLGGFLLFSEMKPSNQEVVRLTMLMLPALIFLSLYALNTSLLQCEKSYFLPSVAPSFCNIVWIVAAFFLWKLPLSLAMERLAMILVFAFCLQWLVTLPSVYQFLKKELGKNWWESKDFSEFSGKECLYLLKPFLIAIIGVTAAQANSAIGTLFARYAHPEGPAYLWYAIRIQQLPLALFGVGLAGALLPPISRAANQDSREYDNFLLYALKQVIVWMIPATFAIFVLAFSGVNLLYGHGEFSKEAVLKTTQCLWGYGWGLFPMTAILILASGFYAVKDYRTPTLISFGAVLFNIILNVLFVFVWKFEAASLASATSITAFGNFFFLAYFLIKKRGPLLKGISLLFSKTVFASLLAASLTIALGSFLLQDNTWNLLQNKPVTFFATQIRSQIGTFAFQALCFSILFLLIAYLLKIQEIFQMFSVKQKA